MPFFAPVSAGGIGKATVTATTGSPTVDTSSRAGKTIYKFTGSGSITVGTAGTCEVLLIGGGGPGGASSSGGGGGGAGGLVYDTGAILPSGTLTVTVGPAGVATPGTTSPMVGTNGYPSRVGNLTAQGGGAGGAGESNGATRDGNAGGSGGGGGFLNISPSVIAGSGGASLLSQGNAGGSALYNDTRNGGGGGAGGTGAAGTSGAHGAGGAGSANSITGTSVTYAAGGGGGGGAGTQGAGTSGVSGSGGTATGGAGTANKGGGGGGSGGRTNGAGSGGSGFVVVVIG